MTIGEVSIPYGKEMLTAKVPKDRVIFDGIMSPSTPLVDFKKILLDKLDNPIDSLPLKDMIKSDDKILFLVEDNTRLTPVHIILPIVVDYLVKHGLSMNQMEILTAPGTHRIMTDEETKAKVGEYIYNNIKISQHDFTDESSIADLGSVFVGDTEIPAMVNKKAVEADFIIGLGNIIPHSDAGFSGGAKIVQPGICAYETTAATHISAALLDDIPLGVIDNPCRQGMELVARKVGLKFIINTVMNNKNEVINLVTGDCVSAHREGARLSREIYGVKIPELADIVIVSSCPSDIDYWQALKGVTSAYFTVKQGGITIFASPCYEGLEHNHPKFRDWLKLSLEDAFARARSTSITDKSGDVIAADLAICNARIRDRSEILMICDNLPIEDIDILGYKKMNTLQDAVDYALNKFPNGTIGVLPRGGDCLPIRD